MTRLGQDPLRKAASHFCSQLSRQGNDRALEADRIQLQCGGGATLDRSSAPNGTG
jgi:hypothetical protein